MIAVDTNILVYAYRLEAPLHDTAFAAIAGLAEGHATWAIAWPCVHEFLSVVTNAKIFANCAGVEKAFWQISEWRRSGNLKFLAESDGHLATLQDIVIPGKARGGQIHDARIAAICLQHGVSELWTADRDFSRYPALKTRNPLVK